jgi:hypothetical protein
MYFARVCGAAMIAVLVSMAAVEDGRVRAGRSAIAQAGPDEAAKAFRKRVDAYVALHKKVAATLPPLKETTDPAEISALERTLGELIRKARPAAHAGDIFGADFGPAAVEIVRSDWRKRSAGDRRALLEELPPEAVAVVNMVYPTTLPLATFPPRLLQLLPELPDEVEYRFLSRNLILRDVKANLVIDVIPSVIPRRT